MALSNVIFVMDQYGWNFPTAFSESLPYQISEKFVEQFMGYLKKSIYGLM
jgi:hypothetical protein